MNLFKSKTSFFLTSLLIILTIDNAHATNNQSQFIEQSAVFEFSDDAEENQLLTFEGFNPELGKLTKVTIMFKARALGGVFATNQTNQDQEVKISMHKGFSYELEDQILLRTLPFVNIKKATLRQLEQKELELLTSPQAYQTTDISDKERIAYFIDNPQVEIKIKLDPDHYLTLNDVKDITLIETPISIVEGSAIIRYHYSARP